MLPSLTLRHNRVVAVGFIFAVACVLVISWSLLAPGESTNNSFKITPSLTHHEITTHPPSLPPIYSESAPGLTDCAERLGNAYIQNASKSLFNYCTYASSSSLNCFRTHAFPEKTDSFCVGTPAVFDREDMKFTLGCTLRDLTDQQVADGIPAFTQFPSYWYETGPRAIFERHVKLDPGKTFQSERKGSPKKYTILVRREGPSPINNLFHHLMQLFSVFLTLDVLQVTLDPATGIPLYRADDIEHTQVVIYDDHEKGPFYDQWTAFAKRPLVRIQGFQSTSASALENIIVPLPGSAAVLWQETWEPSQCEDSSLLRIFSQRMLNFYGLHDNPGPPDRPLVLTFIDRTEKRSLVNKKSYIDDLKVSYPDIEINIVNFASLPFVDQLKTIRKTDVLAGVHGAGLTHGIFLRPGSALVEILPPNFNFRGFRNQAKAMGHHYFTTHAIEHANYTTPNGWQTDDVFIEQARFKALMDAAIKSMYQRGSLSKDVN